MKKLSLLLALTLVVSAIFIIQSPAFMRLWKHYLVVTFPMKKADALIVLGGEPLARPLLAAKFFKEGIASKIFITGIGDAERNRQVLIAAGVPRDAIVIESKAVSTYTNALLLKPILENANIHSALIVTSPFHTRRALATFRKVIPNIIFGVEAASIDWWKKPQGLGDVNRFAFIEFLKTAEYWLLYGVSPILGSASKSQK